MSINIEGLQVVLRAVEPEDVDVMYEWENNPKNWHISSTRRPFSRHMLSKFVEAQQGDLLQGGEVRLMICRRDGGEAVGCVDLFDIDIYNHRAGVGVLIDCRYRRRGYAEDALRSVETYVAHRLALRQLWCNVESDNEGSLALFGKLGYAEIGVKRGWNWSSEGYLDEVMMQRFF